MLSRRKKIVAGTVAAIAVLGLILLLFPSRKRSSPPVGPALTSGPVEPAAGPQAPPAVVAPDPVAEHWPPTPEEFFAIYNVQADFYGRVVDQHGGAVPGVTIVWEPVAQQTSQGVQIEERLQADAEGKFEIHSPSTGALKVRVDVPDGYYSMSEGAGSQRSGAYSYMKAPAFAPKQVRDSMGEPHHGDPAKPVVFTLQKKGLTEPLFYKATPRSLSVGETYRYPVGEDQAHVVEMKYRYDPKVLRVSSVSKGPVRQWGIVLSVPGGGVIEAADPDSNAPESFVAPSDGYSPLIEVKYGAETADQDYKDGFRRQYFARFADKTYGRIVLDVEGMPDGHFATVETWYNPSGSTATEFDPSKRLNRIPR